jgi:hypothetical protein
MSDVGQVELWLARWIRENVRDSRVLIVTDRTELDEQTEKGGQSCPPSGSTTSAIPALQYSSWRASTQNTSRNF